MEIFLSKETIKINGQEILKIDLDHEYFLLRYHISLSDKKTYLDYIENTFFNEQDIFLNSVDMDIYNIPSHNDIINNHNNFFKSLKKIKKNFKENKEKIEKALKEFKNYLYQKINELEKTPDGFNLENFLNIINKEFIDPYKNKNEISLIHYLILLLSKNILDSTKFRITKTIKNPKDNSLLKNDILFNLNTLIPHKFELNKYFKIEKFNSHHDVKTDLDNNKLKNYMMDVIDNHISKLTKTDNYQYIPNSYVTYNLSEFCKIFGIKSGASLKELKRRINLQGSLISVLKSYYKNGEKLTPELPLMKIEQLGKITNCNYGKTKNLKNNKMEIILFTIEFFNIRILGIKKDGYVPKQINFQTKIIEKTIYKSNKELKREIKNQNKNLNKIKEKENKLDEIKTIILHIKSLESKIIKNITKIRLDLIGYILIQRNNSLTFDSIKKNNYIPKNILRSQEKTNSYIELTIFKINKIQKLGKIYSVNTNDMVIYINHINEKNITNKPRKITNKPHVLAKA